MGLGTCELGGFLDEVIVNELQLGDDLLFLTIAVGKPSDENRMTAQQTAYELEAAFVGDDKPVTRFWTADDAYTDNYDKSYFQVLASTSNGQVTSGISTSWADAKLKAVAEAYERQRSAELRIDTRAPANQLGSAWVDPRVAAPLTDAQYQHLTHLQPFDENLEIEWVRGTDRHGHEVFVPIDLVFYPIHNLGRKKVVDTCSSGFATYSTYEEAVRRGLLEVVERDALMRNWYEKMSPPRLDFDTLPVYLQKRVRYWQERGREVYVLDLSQMGVIVIEVVIISNDYPSFVSGAASSLDNFKEAAIKALYEAESRLIHGLNDSSERVIKPEEVHAVLEHELLYAQSKDYHEYVEFLFNGELTRSRPTAHATINSLEEALEPVVVDVSEEGSPLHVVKVLSTKLIPISFGYGADHYTHYTLSEKTRNNPTLPHYFA
jgi:thiazole/oxazole-forming peptide maturase SagD family component